ncbi:transposase [Streptomyces hyaluromycini]|uniref:transposase n=1 Tax=Streptomyces hyaluromycini TaxID=1377993 RepID=UPI00142DE7A9|nr:transposase [Streptomyces hyaluromycini]
MRLEVHAREPFADGHRFAGTGAYEVVTATAHYAVDPEAPAHRCVPDLALAPRDDTGLVRFSGDVEILRPVDGGLRLDLPVARHDGKPTASTPETTTDTVADAHGTARDGLIDDQWKAVVPLLPLGGRGPCPEGLRDQFDGVMWRFRTGGSWRNMPARYGAWQTVHHRFQQWALAGTFESLARASETTAPRPHLLAPLRKAAEEERRLRIRSEPPSPDDHD